MKYFLILPILATVFLSACETTPNEFGNGDPVKALTHTEHAMISARNAALENQHADIKRGELSTAEKAYRAAPKNMDAVLNYTKLLRKVNMVEQADMILKPFTLNLKTATPDILLEYAKLKIQQGDFYAAQILAQEAIVKSDDAHARLVLGTAVDAQGHHQAAENHFRAGLNTVGVDIKLKNNLLNNLALSLIAQDKMTEARHTLSQIKTRESMAQQQAVTDNKNLADQL